MTFPRITVRDRRRAQRRFTSLVERASERPSEVLRGEPQYRVGSLTIRFY